MYTTSLNRGALKMGYGGVSKDTEQFLQQLMYRIGLIRRHGYYFFHLVILCSIHSRAAAGVY